MSDPVMTDGIVTIVLKDVIMMTDRGEGTGRKDLLTAGSMMMRGQEGVSMSVQGVHGMRRRGPEGRERPLFPMAMMNSDVPRDVMKKRKMNDIAA